MLLRIACFGFPANLLSSLVFSCPDLNSLQPLKISWNLTVARSALVAWSRLKPMETIVSKCSSETLSVGVVPAPELQPGNTSGAAKSAPDHTTTQRVSRAAGFLTDFLLPCYSKKCFCSFTWVVHMAHDPICGSIDSSVPSIINCSPASFQGESHLT